MSRSSRMGTTIEDSGGTGADSIAPDAVSAGRTGGRVAAHTVAVAFGLVVVVSAVYYLRITRDSWFYADEWAMALQVRRPQDIFEPYNNHLSVTILGLYRVLLEIFGFTTHLPYRVAGTISLVAVPVAMFLVARRRVGDAAAAVMGLVLLWFRGIGLEPGALNHSLTLLGAVVCAYGLSGRGRRCDILVAASLAFALASSGGGVAVAMAAAVHSLSSRATRSRWLAVVVPSAAWLAWWIVVVPPDSEEVQELRPGVLELTGDAVRYAAESFRFLAFGNRVLGGVLLVAFVVLGAWRARQGLAAAANVLAWSAGLLFWWFGLMWSRWLLIGDPPAFRYQWVAAGFILLAVLPPGQAAAPQWASISTRKGAIVATTGVLVVAAVLAQAVRPDAQAFARAHAGYGRLTRGQAAVLLDPTATVPDDVTFGFPFANRTAGELRAVLDAYGADGGPGETDRLLVVIGAVDLVRGPPGTAPEGCHDLRRPIRTAPDSRIGLYARTGAGTPEVLVRRFGPEWVTVGHLEEGQRATLLLPGYAAGAEWQVNVGEGICVVPARP